MANESVATADELVAARQARGLSVDDIQRQLKIHRRQLDALERGDWAALPGLPFVRGTLRGYGKAVGVDVEPLLATVGGHGQMVELRATSSLDARIGSRGMLGFGNGGSGSRWSWALLALLGIVALALFFGQDRDLATGPSWKGGANTTTTTGTVEPAGGKPAEPAAKEGAAGKETIAILPQPAAASPGAAAPAGQPAAGAATAPAVSPAADSSQAASRDTIPLKLSFDADSWVDIKQSNGKALLYGTQKGQSVSELETKGALTLTIGNAGQVRVEYDGKPVKLKPAPGSGIAKLTLP